MDPDGRGHPRVRVVHVKKVKRKAKPFLNRRCLTCASWFATPWTNYTHLDCIECLRRKRIPLVDRYARPYAPKAYRLESRALRLELKAERAAQAEREAKAARKPNPKLKRRKD